MTDNRFGIDYEIPPVKIGDKVYWYDKLFCHTHLNPLTISAIHISREYKISHIVARPELMPSLSKRLAFYKYGETWFVNEEDALRKMEQEG